MDSFDGFQIDDTLAEKRNPFRLSEKKLRGPYSNHKETKLRLPAICKAVDRVTFLQAERIPLPHSAFTIAKRKGFRFPTLRLPARSGKDSLLPSVSPPSASHYFTISRRPFDCDSTQPMSGAALTRGWRR